MARRRRTRTRLFATRKSGRRRRRGTRTTLGFSGTIKIILIIIIYASFTKACGALENSKPDEVIKDLSCIGNEHFREFVKTYNEMSGSPLTDIEEITIVQPVWLRGEHGYRAKTHGQYVDFLAEWTTDKTLVAYFASQESDFTEEEYPVFHDIVKAFDPNVPDRALEEVWANESVSKRPDDTNIGNLGSVDYTFLLNQRGVYRMHTSYVYLH